MESLLEFTSDEGKVEVSRLLPMDTLHPENYGDAAGGFAQQSAWPQISLHQNIKKEPKGFLWNPQSEFTSDEEKEQVSRLLPLELAVWNFFCKYVIEEVLLW